MTCWRFVAAAVASLAVAAAFPGSAEDTISALISAASLVAVVIGIRRWRPDAASGWWALVAGASGFLVGNAILTAEAAGGSDRQPFPSLADPLFLLGYCLLVVGMTILVRRRSAGSEDDSWLDAAIVATAVGVVIAAFLLHPYVSQTGRSGLDKALTVTYSLLDVGLVAIIVRLTVGAGRRPPSYYLLAAGIVAILAADSLANMHQVGRVGRSWVVISSALCYVIFAAAALHPSMAQITDPPPRREARLSGRRLALLCAALLLVPGLLAVEALRGHRHGVGVLAAGSVAMALLVLGRLARLVRAKERKAARERVLRQAGVDLVAATSRRQIHEAARDALAALVPAGPRTRRSVAESRGGALVVVAANGYRADSALGTELRLPSDPPVTTAGPPVDVPRGGDERDHGHVLAVPLWSQRTLGGALVITTPAPLPVEPALAVDALAGQVSLALDSAALTEEIHRRRHERRFQKLVEHSSDLITVMAADGTVQFVSPASSQLLGLDPEVLVGRPVSDYVHPDDHASVAWMSGPIPAAAAPAEPVELRVRHASGEWRWFEFVVDDALDEPAVDGLIIHARDITDRKAAERRLAESEARFRSLVQNASDLVVVVDGTASIAYVSPSVTRLLGHPAESLLGTSALDLVHKDDAVPATRALIPVNGDAAPSAATELRFRRAEGTWVQMDVTVNDLRHDPAVGGIVLTARDVTERQRSEERWRAFGAEASHQLRTPLTGLRLGIENALGARAPEWQAALEDALRQVERLEATVEDFLALAPRRLDPIPPLDLRPVVADMDAAWRGLIEAEGRRLIVCVERSLPPVHSSPAAVRQVLGVLIENALKHGAGAISVVAKEVAGGIALEVSDEGDVASVASAHPFSARAPSGGSRIGLALARSLAEAEGCRLLLRQSGPSPTFALFLPGSPAAAG